MVDCMNDNLLICGIEQFCSGGLLTTLTIEGVVVSSVFDVLSCR